MAFIGYSMHGGGTTGGATLNLNGTSQTVTVTSGTLPGGNMMISGGTVTLATNVSLNFGSQNLTISTGTLNMAGFNLTVGGTLAISSGATLTKASGTLSYGGLSNSGTLNP